MGIIENAKDLADLIKKAGDTELYRKIVELEGEVVELTREKRGLEDKVAELERTLATHKQMQFKEPFYFQEGDNTPYCPACWENRKKPVHVTFIFDNPERTRWDCPVCQHHYLKEKDRGAAHPARHIPFSGSGGPQGWMGS